VTLTFTGRGGGHVAEGRGIRAGAFQFPSIEERRPVAMPDRSGLVAEAVFGAVKGQSSPPG